MKQILDLLPILISFFKEKSSIVVSVLCISLAGIFGSKYFKQENDFLERQGKQEQSFIERQKQKDSEMVYIQSKSLKIRMEGDSLCEVRTKKFQDRIEILEEKVFQIKNK